MSPRQIEAMPPGEIQALVHELHVYQITLQMQNESLHAAQAEPDITEIRKADAALKTLNIDLQQALVGRTSELKDSVASVKLLSEAVSRLGEGILITTDHLTWPGSRIVFVNDAMCRMSGYAARELVGTTPLILEGRQNDPVSLERLHRELTEGRSGSCEFRNRRKDGTEYESEVHISPLFDPEGRRTHFVSIHRDVTERNRAAEALRREQQFSESIVQTTQSIVLLLDTRGRILRFNPYFAELTGYTLEEARGRSWFTTFLPHEESPRIRKLFKRALAGERTRGNVNRIRTRDGRHLSIEWYDAPLTDGHGQLLGLLCSGHDVTRRLAIERDLLERQEKLRAILNTASDAIINIDRRGLITDVNPATERMFGYAQGEMIGQNVRMLMPAPFRQEHARYLDRYRHTGQPRIIGVGREVLAQRKDGSVLPVFLSVSEVRDLGLYTGILHDISNIRQLQQQIVRVAEEEQKRIAQDLHDGLGSHLNGISLLCQSLVRSLQRRSLPEVRQATRLSILLGEAIQQCRLVAHGLHPVADQPGGLIRALRSLAAEKRKQNVQCRVHCHAALPVLDGTTANHLFRIAQEAVNNAVRHGKASRINLRLTRSKGLLRLCIRDNGQGLPASPAKASQGLGLPSMAYRTGLIHGILDIAPAKGGGVQVCCRVPSPSEPPPGVTLDPS